MMHATARRPDATPTPRAPATEAPHEREVFLDAIRTLALVRVVLWHALALPVLTYFVAAVPAMFSVTGSPLAHSLGRGARRVIVDRARRILVPLWVFPAGAFLAMTIAHRIDGTTRTAVPIRDLLAWLVPVVDPHGSPWEGGYLSSPLWYLRALLWLLLMEPFLLLYAIVRDPPPQRQLQWLAYTLIGLTLIQVPFGLVQLQRYGIGDYVQRWVEQTSELQ